MFDLARAEAVWDRVCACGGQRPELTALHPCRRTYPHSLTPALQTLTLLRLLCRFFCI